MSGKRALRLVRPAYRARPLGALLPRVLPALARDPPLQSAAPAVLLKGRGQLSPISSLLPGRRAPLWWKPWAAGPTSQLGPVLPLLCSFLPHPGPQLGVPPAVTTL